MQLNNMVSVGGLQIYFKKQHEQIKSYYDIKQRWG